MGCPSIFVLGILRSFSTDHFVMIKDRFVMNHMMLVLAIAITCFLKLRTATRLLSTQDLLIREPTSVALSCAHRQQHFSKMLALK